MEIEPVNKSAMWSASHYSRLINMALFKFGLNFVHGKDIKIKINSNQHGGYWLAFQFTSRESWETVPSEADIAPVFEMKRRLYSHSEYQTFVVTWPLSCRDLLPLSIPSTHWRSFQVTDCSEDWGFMNQNCGALWVLSMFWPPFEARAPADTLMGVHLCSPTPLVSEMRQFRNDPSNPYKRTCESSKCQSDCTVKHWWPWEFGLWMGLKSVCS